MIFAVDDPSAANQNYRSAKTLQDSKEELGRAEKHAESSVLLTLQES